MLWQPARTARHRTRQSEEAKEGKSAAKTEGEGECFAAGPLRACGHIRHHNPGLMIWFHTRRIFSRDAG